MTANLVLTSPANLVVAAKSGHCWQVWSWLANLVLSLHESGHG